MAKTQVDWLTPLREMVSTNWEAELAYVQTPGRERLDPAGEFSGQLIMALKAYVLGENDLAVAFLTDAVDHGFPPDFRSDGDSKFERQFKNYQDGSPALRVAIASYLVGHRRQAEIADWAWERLSDTDELLLSSNAHTRGHVALLQAYCSLVAGKPNPCLLPNLRLAQTDVKGSWARHEPPLATTLLALAELKNGLTTREETAGQLRRLLLATRDEHRVMAFFHVLYLQERFPEAFDPVLPGLALAPQTGEPEQRT